jgi:hypothetical protein
LGIIKEDRDAEVVALHGDHCKMVKFQARHEGDYQRVVKYISQFAEEAPGEVEKNWYREKCHRSA